jgi:hypothetical protein
VRIFFLEKRRSRQVGDDGVANANMSIAMEAIEPAPGVVLVRRKFVNGCLKAIFDASRWPSACAGIAILTPSGYRVASQARRCQRCLRRVIGPGARTLASLLLRQP